MVDGDRRRHTPRKPEAGYALLAVLWICVGVGAAGFAISEAAGSAIAASHNRMALTRAAWDARGCLAYTRAALVRVFHAQSDAARPETASLWERVDRLVSKSPPPAAFACTVSAHPASQRPDSLPSDSTADTAAVYLNRAPVDVLAGLPGFTSETVEIIVAARRRARPIMSIEELTSKLSRDGRKALLAASSALRGRIAFYMPAWLITVRAAAGQPSVDMVVEQRVALESGGLIWLDRRWRAE